MLQRLIAALAAAAALAAPAAARQQTIVFDLGASSQKAGGAVNNITTPGDVGLLLETAEDTLGELTTVGFRQLDGWAGINLKGCEGGKPYPSRAMQDSFYLGQSSDRSAKIRIEGLTPAEKYSFTFFASRMESTRKRVARYKIGDRAVELDASNNTENRVSIPEVAAGPDGAVTIDIECARQDGYAYLGVLEIQGKFAKGRLSREPPERLDGPPLVSAKGWAIADGKTGELLWGFNENRPRKIASTTKMMCAWTVLQSAAADPAVLDEVVTASKLADQTGGSTADFREGERVPVGELLYGLMLPSGNDAGNALAEHFNDRLDPPENPELRNDSDLATRANFVAEMNRNARRLGMTNTTYRSPYGDGGTASQFTSTPRDLLKLAWTAMQNPLFRKYVGTRRYRGKLRGPDGSERIAVWKNTNRLLEIEGYDGVKTGTTTQAGACLVSSGHRGSDHLLVAVLGSTSTEGRYVDTRNLFRWAWRQRGHLETAAADAPEPVAARPAAAGPLPSLSAATMRVIRAVVEAAEQQGTATAVAGQNLPGGRTERLRGDRLTEHLFRRAAAAASELPPEVAPRAYALALGIAIGGSDVVRRAPVVGRLLDQMGSGQEQKQRPAVLQAVTMRGRRDSAQHFVVSCALTVLAGPQAAETAGILKEVTDSQRGSGFSFVDLSAGLAGATFATHLGDSKLSLSRLAESFRVEDFLPEKGDLQEGIPWETFQATYGSTTDLRFCRQQAAIRKRILALPGYSDRPGAGPNVSSTPVTVERKPFDEKKVR